MICEIICIDGFLCMSHLDIVHMLSAYVHVIHTLSGHMHIMCTLFAVVLDIFLTDNADVIHMSSLVLFIYPIMYNLVSAHCLHRCTLSMSSACCAHMYTSFTCHLQHSSYTLLSTTQFPHIVSTHAHCQCHLYIVYRCICYVHLISTAVICICTYHPHII